MNSALSLLETDDIRTGSDDDYSGAETMTSSTDSTAAESREERRQGVIVGYALFAETYPARRCEWMLASVLFMVGLVYALAAYDYQVPLYDSSNLMVPRWAWAAVGIGVGGVRLVFLTVNGFYRRSPHWRSIGAGLACLAWLQLTLAALQSPVAGATIAIWPVFFWFDLQAAFTAAGEARLADDHANGAENAGRSGR